MTAKFRRTFLLIPILLCVVAVGGWLLKTAFEHRGFFAYHANILASPTFRSYQDELLVLVRRDPQLAFARYRDILASEPLSYNTCHGIAHKMGHETFETFGFQKAMSFQDGLCGAGYVHGVIEARFGLLQEHDILKKLPTICDNDNRSCYHGIGHGLMVTTHLDIQRSLAYCNLLPALGRRNCYDGVWMHIFDLEESGAPHADQNTAITLDAATVRARVSLCAHTQEPYKISCYFYLPRIYAHEVEASFSDFRTLCDQTEANYQRTCTAGVGHAFMKYHIAEPEISLSKCNAFETDDFISACKEGGLLYYLFTTESTVPTANPCTIFPEVADQKRCLKVDHYRVTL